MAITPLAIQKMRFLLRRLSLPYPSVRFCSLPYLWEGKKRREITRELGVGVERLRGRVNLVNWVKSDQLNR